MKTIIKYGVILLMGFLFTDCLVAQTAVQIQFEEDEKKMESISKFNLYFIVNGVKFTSNRTSTPSLIILPKEMDTAQVCTIVFEFKQYKLVFDHVAVKKIRTKLRFGVDHKPFAAEHLSGVIETKDEKRVEIVHYLIFSNGTERVNAIFKKKSNK